MNTERTFLLEDRFTVFTKWILYKSPKTIVVVAFDKQQHCNVVIKICSNSINKEIQTLKLIKEDIVPKVIAHGTLASGFEYIIMPTLDCSLRSIKTVPLNMGLYIFYELLSCIKIIHSYGICHLDIKPDNIMLKDNKLVIIDFDLSKKDTNKYVYSSGTPYFMSVNLMTPNKKKFSFQYDIQSAYYTLLYLIMGCLPWSSINRHEYKERNTQLQCIKFKKLNLSRYLVNLPGIIQQLEQTCRKEQSCDVIMQLVEDYFKSRNTSVHKQRVRFIGAINHKIK